MGQGAEVAALTQVMEKGPQCRGEPSTSAQYRSHFFCWDKQGVFGYSPLAQLCCLLCHFSGLNSHWEEAQLLLLSSSSLPFLGAATAGFPFPERFPMLQEMAKEFHGISDWFGWKGP